MMVLDAAAAAYEELHDINTFVVVFAENADGSGERFELQRAFTFDEQDVALGMDTYCLCVSSGATHYGGVQSWWLGESVLDLKLTRGAAVELGIDTHVQVQLHLTPRGRATLLDGLRRVLAEVDERHSK